MGWRYKVPFVLASTAHGPVILNMLDWRQMNSTHIEVGVGLGLLIEGEYDIALVSLTIGALEARHQSHGQGVIAVDCGANVGIYSMDWARAMEGWGSIIAFEPQERMFYALAGNLAINNLYNVKALNKAVGWECGIVDMPLVDYHAPNQFGGISLKNGIGTGKHLPKIPVEIVTIDSLGLPRLDFLKLDIEGMEPEALEGARSTIEANKPFILLEWHICGKEPVEKFMKSIGFEVAYMGMNMFAGPPGDVMERFKTLSKQTGMFNVRTGGPDIRESINGGTRTGQQDSTGVAG